MCDAPCSKKILIFLNIIFFLAGAGLLGIGLWMRLDPMLVNYLHVVNIDQTDPLIDYAGTVFMAVGGAAFIISVIGCCGAIREHQGFLFIYIILLLLLIVGEIVGAVLALVYRSKIEGALMDSMEKQVREDYTSGNVTYTPWNYLQFELKCCGANNYTDYIGSYWWNNDRKPQNETEQFVPDQCCVASQGEYDKPIIKDWKQCQNDAKAKVSQSEALYTGGCYQGLEDWFMQHSLIMMLLGFAIGAIQILGLITACGLRNALKKSPSQ